VISGKEKKKKNAFNEAEKVPTVTKSIR
jgi:hypothetical protein